MIHRPSLKQSYKSGTMEFRHGSKKLKKKDSASSSRKSDTSANKSREQVRFTRSDPTSSCKKGKAEPSSDKLARKSSNRSFGQVIAPFTRKTVGLTRAASFSLKKKRHEAPLSTVDQEQRVTANQYVQTSPSHYASCSFKSHSSHNEWRDIPGGHCSRLYDEFDHWQISIPEIAIQDYSTFYSDDVEDQTDYFRQAEWAIRLLEDHLGHGLHASVDMKQGKRCKSEESINKADSNLCSIDSVSHEPEESEFRRGLSSLIYPLSSGAATIVQKSSRVADLTNRLFRSMHIDIIRKRRALTPKKEHADSNTNSGVDNNDYLWNRMGSFSKDRGQKNMPLQD